MRIYICAVFFSLVVANPDLEKCDYTEYSNAMINPNSDTLPFRIGRMMNEYKDARDICNEDQSCRAIATGIQDTTLFVTTADENGLLYSDNGNCTVWLKTCENDIDYKLITAPEMNSYFEPVMQGTLLSMMTILKNINLKQSFLFDGIGQSGLIPSGSFQSSVATSDGYRITLKEFPLPDELYTESVVDSWCTYTRCVISPRTYYHPVTSNFSIIGLTDDTGLGHVFLLDQSNTPYKHVEARVDGVAGKVAGIYGFHDRRFAVMIFMDSLVETEREIYLQFYRSDCSIEWSTFLNSAISTPDRNVGDFRLSYGDGYFAAYFSVYGIDNFANATNGEQLSFVTDRGVLKTTSFPIPNQEFVQYGDAWGCSHSLGQLVDYHSIERQFITVCTADLFPKGISLGDSLTGTLIYKADGNGRGFSTAQLGQLAEGNTGYKLVFNALNAECCEGRGIGFTTIYNAEDPITGQQSFDPITWLTSTNGTAERDPSMARNFLTDDLYAERETFLIGWFNNEDNQYILGIANTFGNFIRNPTTASKYSFSNADGLITCEGDCVFWGNRDDSFNTLPNGHVGWIYAPPVSSSIWMYDVQSGPEEATGWSLWSGWSQCSLSCNGGVSTRVRSCLSGDCKEREGGVETMECNVDECTIPITCEYDMRDGFELNGDLFVNGQRQFAFTLLSAQEKCTLFRDLCAGITRTMSSGFYFYFLKTSTELLEMPTSQAWIMSCEETPGWASWSTWVACSVTCNGGMRRRTRFCDGDDPGSEVCDGSTEEAEECNVGECPDWSVWGAWSECSQSCDEGLRERTRTCTGDYPEACDTLQGPSFETTPCSLGVCSEWSAWESWSECSTTCEDGVQERFRICRGDFPCPISKTGLGEADTQDCNLGVCPFWATWESWGECGATCGDSTRFRERECLGDFPVGEPCPLEGEPSETGACNLGACPFWAEWGPWGGCSTSCDNGFRERSRACLGDFPIEFCEELGGEIMDTDACNLGECARLDEWVAWSECSMTCGEGTQTRTRDCLGDFECAEDQLLLVNEPCNLGECPSWGAWGSWGPCSVTCGDGGARIRSRPCEGDFPELCDSSGFEDVGECEGLLDCARWTVWSQWGSCSRTCDVGEAMRRRTCGSDYLETCDFGANDTGALEDENRRISMETNRDEEFEQNEARNCSYGRCSFWLDWVTWSACSATCDEGTRQRSRECFGDFPRQCVGDAHDAELCSRGQCGAWTGWSAWGQCSQSCGLGQWSRSRACFGDFPDTCVGETMETEPCDVSDCVAQCDPSPCNNNGVCRYNEQLTRLYHCICAKGWQGKNCDFRGPDIFCGLDNILVSFDRRVVADEGLLDNNPDYVSLISSNSIGCKSFFDSYNNTDYYVVVVPSPVDTACGSTIEITPSEYRIRNQVLWQVTDVWVRSTVILMDFTCVYQRNLTISSAEESGLSIESYRREVEVTTSSGTFEVDISLFRNSAFTQPIFVDEEQESQLVSLAEGEVVFVAVDLRSKDLLPSDDAVLVMDTCFVTSSQSTREPLLYLIEESCPVTPFVTIISNGDSRSGRFAVRVFGWTGRDTRAENVFIHCTVSVCNIDEGECKPNCFSATGRKRRSISQNQPHLQSNREIYSTLFHTMKKNDELAKSRQAVALSRNGHPYTAVIKVVPPNLNGTERVNLKANRKHKFDTEKMVSVGPFEIVLFTSASRRGKRDIEDKTTGHKEFNLLNLYILLGVGSILSVFIMFAFVYRKRKHRITN